MTGGGPSAARPAGRALMLPGLVVAGSVLYLLARPRTLGMADESYLLFEAKRLVGGDALYRDIFEFVMPLSWWTMAAAFRTFGTSLTTARLVMAVVHGTIVLASYVACRRVGVRPRLAWMGGAAHLALCHAAWPYASPHWFSTCLVMLLLVLCLHPATGRTMLATGLVAGTLIGVQQQRGVFMLAAVGVLLGVRALIDARFAGTWSWRRLLSPGALLAVGTAAVVLPVLAAVVATAGWDPAFHALVTFPLTNYRRTNQTAWGSVDLVSIELAQYTLPRLLAALPLALLAPLAAATRAAWRRADRERCERMAALVVLGLGSIASVLYYPDFIHVAFIASTLFVALAVALEDVCARLDRRGPWGSPVLVAALTLALAWQLGRNLALAHRSAPASYESAFGRIATGDPGEARLVATLRARLATAPSTDLFCYPTYASLYLTTGATNPTAYQLYVPFFNGPEPLRDIIATLDARQVPHIVIARRYVAGDDPFVRYVEEHYEPVDLGPGATASLHARKP